ncbi:hypothetical protein THAOC_21622, partial [Thalassiosira oceanica]
EKKEKLKQILKSQKRKKKRGAPEYSSPKKHKVLKNFKEASKKEKCHQIEYERLKREIGYTSPEASSRSHESKFSTLPLNVMSWAADSVGTDVLDSSISG